MPHHAAGVTAEAIEVYNFLENTSRLSSILDLIRASRGVTIGGHGHLGASCADGTPGQDFC
jgi:hypothetical protein